MLSSLQKLVLRKQLVTNPKKTEDEIIAYFIENDALLSEEALKSKIKPHVEAHIAEQQTRVNGMNDVLGVNQGLLDQMNQQFNEDYPA